MTSCTAPRGSQGASARTAAGTRTPGIRLGSLMLAALALGACDIPTGLPIIETRFVIPGETTTLSVNELLPSSITTVGTSFRLSLAAQTIPTRTLGEMCGSPCQSLQGQTVPKPAFTANIPVSIDIPDDVATATLAGGSVIATLTHNFGFDPLQPAGRTEDGELTLIVRSNGTEMGRATLATDFPSGSTRTMAVQLQPGTVITGDLDAEIELISPAGGTAPSDWITIDNSAALAGVVEPRQIDISSAGVLVQNRTVTAANVLLDLSDIDETMRDNVKSGAIVLAMSNPFALSGTMQLQLTPAGGAAITKQVTVAAGETRQRVEFTGAELQSLLGRAVTMTLSGTLNSANPVTITPGQAISISTMLDLVFELGSGD